MPKDSPRSTQFEWLVVRIKSTPAAIVGYVQAPDAEQAIKAAIERYEISSPIEQARLDGGLVVGETKHAGWRQSRNCNARGEANRSQDVAGRAPQPANTMVAMKRAQVNDVANRVFRYETIV
jgi:hypothetical protein